MKQLFYLTGDENEFIETMDSEIITWIYRWDSKTSYSFALRELVETNYNLN